MTLAAKELFTRQEVAKIFGVTPETVKEWQKHRGLKVTWISQTVLRYARIDIEQFIAAAKR